MLELAQTLVSAKAEVSNAGALLDADVVSPEHLIQRLDQYAKDKAGLDKPSNLEIRKARQEDLEDRIEQLPGGDPGSREQVLKDLVRLRYLYLSDKVSYTARQRLFKSEWDELSSEARQSLLAKKDLCDAFTQHICDKINALRKGITRDNAGLRLYEMNKVLMSSGLSSNKQIGMYRVRYVTEQEFPMSPEQGMTSLGQVSAASVDAIAGVLSLLMQRFSFDTSSDNPLARQAVINIWNQMTPEQRQAVLKVPLIKDMAQPMVTFYVETVVAQSPVTAQNSLLNATDFLQDLGAPNVLIPFCSRSSIAMRWIKRT